MILWFCCVMVRLTLYWIIKKILRPELWFYKSLASTEKVFFCLTNPIQQLFFKYLGHVGTQDRPKSLSWWNLPSNRLWEWGSKPKGNKQLKLRDVWIRSVVWRKLGKGKGRGGLWAGWGQSLGCGGFSKEEILHRFGGGKGIGPEAVWERNILTEQPVQRWELRPGVFTEQTTYQGGDGESKAVRSLGRAWHRVHGRPLKWAVFVGVLSRAQWHDLS